MSRAILALVAVMTLALGACADDAAPTNPQPNRAGNATASGGPSGGPASTPAGGGGAPRPCAVVTRAEAATAAGIDLHPGIESTIVGKRSCTYIGVADAGQDVFVVVWSGGMAAFEQERRRTATAVAGLGDAAFLQTDLNITLTVLKGDTIVQTSVSKGFPNGAKVVRDLATIALGRV